MIYCSINHNRKVGGNLGNMCMRIMSMMGLAKKYNTIFSIPDWPYAKYFENDIPQINFVRVNRIVKEPYFHYCENLLHGFNFDKDVIDLHGFYQSYKYWGELLQFKKGYLASMRRKYDFSKRPIAISVRRGDFVNHPLYLQLPLSYYLYGLSDNFPDYKERSVFVFSDDMNYCRENFHFDNAIFVDAPDIEQLAVMTLCDDFILSNSTFSFVGAYLANCGKVIRPVRNFDGAYVQKNSEKDYWPDRWEIYEYADKIY